jgi:outer membrane murein-binding lipoprotein Lpp
VTKTVKLTAAVAVAAFLLAGCTTPSKDDKARDELQAQKATGNTLEKQNLTEKRKREENPNAIGYVYLVSFGKPFGYYVTKGKISANGSQLTPTDDVIWTCRSGSCSPVTVDGPQDDGSYGDKDPGIFFFTADGTKVVTDLDYIHSDQPLAIDVPRLDGKK